MVETYGEERVNAAGVAALGYPAVLATRGYEVEAIRRKLNPNPNP